WYVHCSIYRRDASRVIPSFPTRRSSDLTARAAPKPPGAGTSSRPALPSARGRRFRRALSTEGAQEPAKSGRSRHCPAAVTPSPRSEEHTSELQSRENLVCRLLLEKKKNR